MTQEQIKHLTDLKDLLDSGVLSQEEFNAEKANILCSENGTEETPKHNIGVVGNNISEFVRKIKPYYAWILLAAIIVVVLIAVLLPRKPKETAAPRDISPIGYEQAQRDADSVFQAALDQAEEMWPDEDERDRVLYGEDYPEVGHWKKYYFKDDFDDDMPDHPYVETFVQNNAYLLEIWYVGEKHIIAMSLHDKDGGERNSPYGLKNIYGPSVISIKTSDGRAWSFDADNVAGALIYIVNPDNVNSLCQIFEQGNFKMNITYELYSERHSQTFNVTNETQRLYGAVNKYLR